MRPGFSEQVTLYLRKEKSPGVLCAGAFVEELVGDTGLEPVTR